MIMDLIINIAVFLIAAVIFTFVGIGIRKKIAESKLSSAENEAKQIIERAKIEAENSKKEQIFKAKEEILSARKDLDDEIRERRGEVQQQERRVIQKEENLERKLEMADRKERDLNRKEEELKNSIKDTLQKLNRLSPERFQAFLNNYPTYMSLATKMYTISTPLKDLITDEVLMPSKEKELQQVYQRVRTIRIDQD